MRLLPRETDKLLLHSVGSLAQKRLARGLKLNLAEATALIASQVVELIRDGKHSVSQLMCLGTQLLGTRHVLDDVPMLLQDVQVEGTFLDGTKLVTIHNPISSQDGDLALALYGSFLPVPSNALFGLPGETIHVAGQVTTLPGHIVLNKDKPRCLLKVTSYGDRPIQVGSHYHFIEANPHLEFDRVLAYGKRLDITAGTAVRFEPGEQKLVSLIDIAGERVIHGGNGIATGKVDLCRIHDLMAHMKEKGFRHVKQQEIYEAPLPFRLDRARYADAFGPTTGDKIRLGDTNILIEIEMDFATYGDEIVFGGGKVIREGMGQSTGMTDDKALDLVITNAIILDYTGIYKADIGIKKGIIVGIGKAGNPHIMDGVDDKLIVGVTTEVLAGEGHIFTAGAIDTHIHFICPQLCIEALASGTTTLIGGGTGPNTGTNATTCTPGDTHIKMMLKATDNLPLNFGFTGKGNSSSQAGLVDQVISGAIGLKLHEDWGSSPQAIDTCLHVCEKYDIQSTIHTDTLNESGFVETTIEAFKGRTIHAYHSEGAGGGHAPDIIKVCGLEHVIPSSTNPTRPYTVNTIDEHLDMLMVCHHLSKDIPEDIAFAESRIRGETIGAEDYLHDIGAISIISSDSQAMGRVGEVISRTWQTAHKMKDVRREFLDQSTHFNDNIRAKRYISKYTINPAIAHGISHIVGSIEVGKLADIVMYKPSLFGTRPELILKGGMIVWSQMGDANASIPTPQPVLSRSMFGAFPSVIGMHSLAFLSQVSLDMGTISGLGLNKRLEGVKNCRIVGKKDMKWNNYCPKIEVDPETYVVKVDDVEVNMQPALTVPMSQRVYLF